MLQAIGTAAVIGFPIALSGTIGFVATGLRETGLPPYSVGFVFLPALGGIVVASMLVAPLGAAAGTACPRCGSSGFRGALLRDSDADADHVSSDAALISLEDHEVVLAPSAFFSSMKRKPAASISLIAVCLSARVWSMRCWCVWPEFFRSRSPHAAARAERLADRLQGLSRMLEMVVSVAGVDEVDRGLGQLGLGALGEDGCDVCPALPPWRARRCAR